MGFSRQEYWSRLPFPPPGDLLDPGIEPESLASPALAGGLFTTSTTGEAQNVFAAGQIWLPWWLSSGTGQPAQEIEETQAQSLGWEDPLGEEMATYSRIIAWRIPWTQDPGGLQVGHIGSQGVRHD